MRSKIAVLTFLCSAARAETPPLDQAEMQQVLRALQSQFSQPDAVGFEALNRAAIAGLLQQNPQTMQLVTVPAAPAAATAPVKAESLTPRIACVRPGALRKEDATAVREALTKLAAGETAAVILDLRAAAADSDPALAVDFVSLFLPKGSAVTGTVKTEAEPVWTKDLMVLADTDTPNTGEVIAALLQFHQRAVLIGTPTRGRTAAVAELPLRKVEGGTLTLRFTAQRVVFPAGATDPFGKGLTPDISAPLDAKEKAAVFALQTKEGLARGVFQTAQPRANEAALVARTNPEIPDRIARTAGKAEEAPPVDRPLQLAVDSITTQMLLKP